MGSFSHARVSSSRRGGASRYRGPPLVHLGHGQPGQVVVIGEVDCLGAIGHAPVVDSADECGHDRGRRLIGCTGEFQCRLGAVWSFQ